MTYPAPPPAEYLIFIMDRFQTAFMMHPRRRVPCSKSVWWIVSFASWQGQH